MKDRFGNELKVGDKCVCFSTMRTGSSTSRLVQYEGEVIGFTKCHVKVKCTACCYSHTVGTEFKCIEEYVFKKPMEVDND